jgi:hypothetical protein
MAKILSGTGGTEVELRKKFHLGKGLTVELSVGTLALRRVQKFHLACSDVF